MGYIKGTQVDVLPLPSDPTYTVTMRRKAKYGADLAMQDAMIKISPQDMAAFAKEAAQENGHEPNGSTSTFGEGSKIEVAASTRSLLLSLIVSWTLTDEHDQPLPLTLENIDELEPEDGRFLAAEAKKRLKKRTEEERRPLSKPSGLPSRRSQAKASPHRAA